MSRHATTTGADRLLHSSPDRTLFVTTDTGSGRPVVCKLFVRGSVAAAEREVAIARSLIGLDIAVYREARLDPASNRPCILLDFHDGTNLDQFVAEHGALPAEQAAALLAPVARTLAAMHGRRTKDAPLGICHGDVKPANLLVNTKTTLLLDFEQALPIRHGAEEGDWITGTAGFLAPEGHGGAAPTAAIDIFGLGATLQWLLTGGNTTALPQDPAVRDLLLACMASDPEQRPAAHLVATTLTALAQRLADDPEEQILNRLCTGERLEFVFDSPRYGAMQQLAGKQRRLLARLPQLLSKPLSPPTTPAGLQTALRNAQRVLRHFPRNATALLWRAELGTIARDMVATAAATIASRQREEQFDEAMRWLDAAMVLTHTLQNIPGRLPFPGASDPRTAGLLQRDPIAFLQRLRQQIGEGHQELAAAVAMIDDAEQRLDLVSAELAIDAMAERYGGSSPTAARRRDQLHRLAFYLNRIASSQQNVERIAQLWDKSALDPLSRFVGECAGSPYRSTRDDQPTAPLGLRSLQVTLVNLVEELPHLYTRSGPAHDALGSALKHISDVAWELVTTARRQLDAVPVPVRPMQITLGRLDTFRILEALVDRPERPRSQLLDIIESLRLKFEQARAARDRLAEGAEQAMARGHWTTGLFDMERAVAGLNPSDEAERDEARRLQARLAEAKSKKREIAAAVRRNVELTNRYGVQQDDATSSFNQRLQSLIERRDCLHFLAVSLPAERATLYTHDLREVELQITLEQAGLAETELDGSEETGERLRLSRLTLERLEASLSTSEFAGEPPGRLLRLRDHWRTVVEQCQRDKERRAVEHHLHLRGRRRMAVVATAALAIAVSAVGWAASPWLFGDAAAAVHQPSTASALAERVSQMPLALRAPADRLIAVVRRAPAAQTRHEIEAWHHELTADLLAFASASANANASSAEPEVLRSFAADCWRTGLWTVAANTDAAGHDHLRTLTATLAERLAAFRVPTPSVSAPSVPAPRVPAPSDVLPSKR